MTAVVPRTLREVAAVVARGEGKTIEFKRSTAELREGLQTGCAFLNGGGGFLLFGVRPDGTVEGQHVSDKTVREIAQAMVQFEPPVPVDISVIPGPVGREVLVLSFVAPSDSIPFTFEGRPYQRSGSTTRKMAQERYEGLLLERAHSRRRWENQVADGDHHQGHRPRRGLPDTPDHRAVIGRLAGPSAKNLSDAARSPWAAQGRPPPPGRGRALRQDLHARLSAVRTPHGAIPRRDKTEFIDQRQLRGPAFKLLEEAQTLLPAPLPAAGEDRSGAVAPGRDTSDPARRHAGDPGQCAHPPRLLDRRRSGVARDLRRPRRGLERRQRTRAGSRADALTREHLSVQRNPIIADIFSPDRADREVGARHQPSD